MRFVECINVAVIPVINDLTGAAHQRTGERDACKQRPPADS